MFRFFVLIALSVPAFAWFAAGRVTTRIKSLRMSDDEPAICIGHGFDIHRLIEGTPLVIGGVTIPYSKGADAHSDGDAMYHSIVDSILGYLLTQSLTNSFIYFINQLQVYIYLLPRDCIGALALPDIGQLFPDNDPKWKGADSSIFMEEAYRKMTEKGSFSFTYLFTYLLTYSLTYLLTYLLAYSLTHSLTHPLTHSSLT